MWHAISETVLYIHEDLRQRLVGECQRVHRGKIPEIVESVEIEP